MTELEKAIELLEGFVLERTKDNNFLMSMLLGSLFTGSCTYEEELEHNAELVICLEALKIIEKKYKKSQKRWISRIEEYLAYCQEREDERLNEMNTE